LTPAIVAEAWGGPKHDLKESYGRRGPIHMDGVFIIDDAILGEGRRHRLDWQLGRPSL
jgi:hypothetical protein